MLYNLYYYIILTRLAKRSDTINRQEEIEKIRIIIHNSTSTHNRGMIGTLAVIKYLYKNECEVSSKEISDKLNVSSARMTILLKKLEKDNIIVIEPSKHDARSINVKLTDHGNMKSKEIEDSFIMCIDKLLDIFGYDELCTLLDKVDILRNIFNENLKIDLKGEKYV